MKKIPNNLTTFAENAANSAFYALEKVQNSSKSQKCATQLKLNSITKDDYIKKKKIHSEDFNDLKHVIK